MEVNVVKYFEPKNGSILRLRTSQATLSDRAAAQALRLPVLPYVADADRRLAKLGCVRLRDLPSRQRKTLRQYAPQADLSPVLKRSRLRAQDRSGRPD